MTVTAPELQRNRSAPPNKRGRRPGPIEAATAIEGAALAVLVGADGTPGWRVVRVVVVVAVTTLAVLAQLRVAPRRRGRLAVAAGVPAVAVAAGLVLHVGPGGTIVLGAVAIVLAFTGLGLLVGGTVVATRGRRPVRRVATGAAVLVVAALVGRVVGPAVAATNVTGSEIGTRPTAVGLAYEDARVLAIDGVPLAAWYVPSTNRAAVVLLHGAGSTRSSVLPQAIVLARAGFGVLILDARGHGESGGRAMDFGWYGDADVAAATDYLASRADVDPRRVGAVGLSMGGEEALGASATNPLLQTVVAEGATARNAADEAWLSDAYGVRGWLQEQLEWLQDRVTDVLTDASPPTSLRAAVGRSGGTRYLLITAGTMPDEGRAAAYVASAAPDRVSIWTVPGAGHTGGLATAPEAWTSRVVGFLTDTLLGDAD